MEADFDPTDPSRYRQWTEEKVRFADLDPLGHVNNNAIGVYFEQARVELFENAGYQLGADGRSVSVARLVFEYREELRYPAVIRVGTVVRRIGRSSVMLACAIFDRDRCIATNEAVCVLIDLGTRRPIPVPDPVRALLLDH